MCRNIFPYLNARSNLKTMNVLIHICTAFDQCAIVTHLWYLLDVFLGKSITKFLHYGYTVQTAPAQDFANQFLTHSRLRRWFHSLTKVHGAPPFGDRRYSLVLTDQ